MRKKMLYYSLRLVVTVCLSVTSCFSEVWTTASSYTGAKIKARAEGKLILADFGQIGCSDCEGMEARFHDTYGGNSQKIQAGFVYWWANYNSIEARPWTKDLVGYALPFIFYIDPDSASGSSMYSTTGLIPSSIISTTLRNLSRMLPLVVTNLPGGIVTNAGRLTLGGVARTNSPLIMAITGVNISNIWWRANDTGNFASVSPIKISDAIVNWAVDFVPINGTNIFESYVQYVNNSNSWTNKVRFVYSGPEQPPSIVGFSQTSTGFVLHCVGLTDKYYVQLATSNFVSPVIWTSIATNKANTNGTFDFLDSQAINYKHRFYRIKTL